MTIKQKLMLLGVTFLFSASNYASVVIGGTRVIYPAEDKEVSVKVNNVGKNPVLIQSWIDNGNTEAKPESIQVPFILTPPINRVEPGKGQTLRISATANSLPVDKESVFWLNVLEIPAKQAVIKNENYLQMAYRTRIKLFYRPSGLQGDANESAKRLTWTADAATITASNPTAYHASLVTVTVNGKTVEGQMVPPYSSVTFRLAGSSGNKLAGEYVNDYGAVKTFESAIR
ncbi:fimbria/pilus periplasmic chaperone [Enterobacter cloacae]|uniref:molecular chaperone n=1 Tax=Enterobacter cloacae TaxID=550 RepID=UPI0034A2CFF0